MKKQLTTTNKTLDLYNNLSKNPYLLYLVFLLSQIKNLNLVKIKSYPELQDYDNQTIALVLDNLKVSELSLIYMFLLFRLNGQYNFYGDFYVNKTGSLQYRYATIEKQLLHNYSYFLNTNIADYFEILEQYQELKKSDLNQQYAHVATRIKEFLEEVEKAKELASTAIVIYFRYVCQLITEANVNTTSLISKNSKECFVTMDFLSSVHNALSKLDKTLDKDVFLQKSDIKYDAKRCFECEENSPNFKLISNQLLTDPNLYKDNYIESFDSEFS